jgi:predicted dehydrogenase
MENDRLIFTKNEVPMSKFSRTTASSFDTPKTTDEIIAVSGHGEQHIAILRNFADSILEGVPLIAPAAEGLLSVELANAVLLSAFEDRTVKLPLDGQVYEKALQQKIAASSQSGRKLTSL